MVLKKENSNHIAWFPKFRYCKKNRFVSLRNIYNFLNMLNIQGVKKRQPKIQNVVFEIQKNCQVEEYKILK